MKYYWNRNFVKYIEIFYIFRKIWIFFSPILNFVPYIYKKKKNGRRRKKGKIRELIFVKYYWNRNFVKYIEIFEKFLKLTRLLNSIFAVTNQQFNSLESVSKKNKSININFPNSYIKFKLLFCKTRKKINRSYFSLLRSPNNLEKWLSSKSCNHRNKEKAMWL